MPKKKTPGVYIVEKDAFPNSVVQVATAVPAFIGYTETAMKGSTPLTGVPQCVTSMSEFISFFGGAPAPKFQIMSKSDADARKDHRLPQAEFTTQGATFAVVHETPAFALFGAMRHFFANGGDKCYVVSVGSYQDNAIEPAKLTAGIEVLKKEQEHSLVLIPETTRLKAAEAISVQQAMLAHCNKKANRFAILDISEGHLPIEAGTRGKPIEAFRTAIGTNFLDQAAAYYPWLDATVFSNRDFTFANIGDGSKTKFAELLEHDQSAPSDEVTAEIKKIATSDVLTEEAAQNLDKTLRAVSPLYQVVMRTIAQQENAISPGAAMAGIYTMVDGTRGVWKAPANVSVSSVKGPIVAITHNEQADLNVSPHGKSINAIRPFVGEGTLVWGARTLDGNSQDWRYISVRRTLMMIEESLRIAIKSYVFEPNDANTWATVRAMAENFLTGIWKQGGLAGVSPSEAFSVRVGLGETMTEHDTVAGVMNVSVLVAITRPAEFIGIDITQQMQTS